MPRHQTYRVANQTGEFKTTMDTGDMITIAGIPRPTHLPVRDMIGKDLAKMDSHIRFQVIKTKDHPATRNHFRKETA